MTLLCNPIVHGNGFVHVLNDTVHSVDEAVYRIGKKVLTGRTVSVGYVTAGCDFNPSVYGIGHEIFLSTLCLHVGFIGALDDPTNSNVENFETFICLVFLCKLGIRALSNSTGMKKEFVR